MVDANQGWRMPGDREPRWDVATAAQCARALERLGVYWLEEPLRTDDIEGYALLRRKTDLRIAAGELVRSAHEARDLVLRGGVDVLQPDVVLSGGISGCRRLAALADLCGRMWSPHTWSNGYGLVANLHLALAVSTCPYVEVPFDPPAWSAERRDWLLPAPVEIAADGTIAPPPGPGSASTPDLDALEAHRRLMTEPPIRAAVLREPGRPVVVETVTLDPPGPGEVLVRVAAAGVCHSDLHLADGRLGEGRWPMVLGHEGAGVVEAVGAASRARQRPATRSAFGFVPSAAPSGPRAVATTLRRRLASRGLRACSSTERRACIDGNGETLQHGLMVACFAERGRRRRLVAAAVLIPRAAAVRQAALLGCGAVTGIGAVRNVAHVQRGETVCVIGCGGVGLR